MRDQGQNNQITRSDQVRYADYRRWSNRATDWIEGYHASMNDLPVRSAVKPGDILARIPDMPPEQPEEMERVFADFEKIIPDGLTHWQHPRFFAYFSANAAPASMIAEQIASAIGAVGMLWQTSPAVTELEIAMTGWMRAALGLPSEFSGVIQDSASSATLAAILTMRESALDFEGNRSGLSESRRIRIYASDQAHSSLDKAIRIAGVGQDNLVKIPTDDSLSMSPQHLEKQIEQDRKDGHCPAGVAAVIGGTSIGASDRLRPILEICRDQGLYSHVDAAWAGSAMICPEFRHVWDGIELADSLVFNPHKWLGAQFDCSVQFLADPSKQVQTLSVRPGYLQTREHAQVTDFSDWSIQLGRRFRALKIWFLLRAYGLEGLRQRIRNHVAWAQELEDRIAAIPEVEITSSCRFSLFAFRHVPSDESDPDAATDRLLQAINSDGRVYLTQTTDNDKYVIRVQVGQFDTTREDVLTVADVVRELLPQ